MVNVIAQEIRSLHSSKSMDEDVCGYHGYQENAGSAVKVHVGRGSNTTPLNDLL